MRDEEGKVLTAGDVFYNNGNRPSNFCRLPSMCSLRIGTSANLKPNLLLSLSLNTSWQARSSVTVTVTVTVTA
jgi:hypothetical protein